MLAVGARSGVGAQMLRPASLFNPVMFDRVHHVKPSVLRPLRDPAVSASRRSLVGGGGSQGGWGYLGPLHRGAGIGETGIRFESRRVGNRQHHRIRRHIVRGMRPNRRSRFAVVDRKIVRSRGASMPKAGLRAIASS